VSVVGKHSLDREDSDDISVLLIRKKAGYGLARPKWFRTLEQIRQLVAREQRSS
jgi:hypothetical protein